MTGARERVDGSGGAEAIGSPGKILTLMLIESDPGSPRRRPRKFGAKLVSAWHMTEATLLHGGVRLSYGGHRDLYSLRVRVRLLARRLRRCVRATRSSTACERLVDRWPFTNKTANLRSRKGVALMTVLGIASLAVRWPVAL